MENNVLIADKIIGVLRNLNLKKNQKVGQNNKKQDGFEYIKITDKDITELCLQAHEVLSN